MKKTLLYAALAVTTLFGASSCSGSFMEIDPVGAVSEGTLTTNEGINQVLTGAYGCLYGNYAYMWTMGNQTLNDWIYGDIIGADANKGSTAGDQADITQLETYSIDESNSYFTSKWSTMFEGIKRCNNVLSMANKMGESLENAQYVIGQAKFLKGAYYFELIRMYGAAIPYITVEDYEANTDPQVSNVDENGAYIYIWDKVAEDLKDAMNSLPEDWTANGEYGRATKYMAEAELGKLYLYWSSPYNGKNGTANHYADAKACFKDVIDNGHDAKGQKYTLAPNYQTLFTPDGDWCGEGIFDVQTTNTGTSEANSSMLSGFMCDTPALGGWGFYQPTYEFVNSFITDVDGLPLKNYTEFAPLTNPNTMTNDLQTTVDPRLDCTVGRFGVPYWSFGTPAFSDQGSWIRDYTNGGLYLNKKYIGCSTSERASVSCTGSTNKNFHVIRLADVYLMYAECCIVDNDLQTARTYINKVRERAAQSYATAVDESSQPTALAGVFQSIDLAHAKVIDKTYGNYCCGLYPESDFDSQASAWQILKREYRLEFGMESHRWFDIARWGEAAEVLNEFRSYENNYVKKYNNTYEANWVTLPIPLTEIQAAEGRIVQNENWK